MCIHSLSPIMGTLSSFEFEADIKGQTIIYCMPCENIGKGYFCAEWENKDTQYCILWLRMVFIHSKMHNVSVWGIFHFVLFTTVNWSCRESTGRELAHQWNYGSSLGVFGRSK